LLFFNSVADGCDGGLDGVVRADVNPVLGRKVVEGEQRLAILKQASTALGFFDPKTATN